MLRNPCILDNFFINVIDIRQDSETDLTHVTDNKLQFELLSLIKNYSPEKSKTVDIKMKINLTDENPHLLFFSSTVTNQKKNCRIMS